MPADDRPFMFLRCPLCGHLAPCDDDDLARYIEGGWPWCCGETMTLLVEVVRPTRVVAADPDGG